jgi:hypothetical protein
MEYNIIVGILCNNFDNSHNFIIEQNLHILSSFCHKIIIVNTNNNNGITDLYNKYYNNNKEFSKVNYYIEQNNNNQSKQILIDKIIPYNPDYIIMLDSNEIISSSIIDFFNNIDKFINVWKIPILYLWGNEDFYRFDKSRNDKGINVNWDPFNGGEFKEVIIKYNNKIKYNFNNYGFLINTLGLSKKTVNVQIFNYQYLNSYENHNIFNEMNYDKRQKCYYSTLNNLKIKKINDNLKWNI